ncbi:TPA: hypothetical protein ACSP2M_002937, partial [Aeromonas hydrophila]
CQIVDNQLLGEEGSQRLLPTAIQLIVIHNQPVTASPPHDGTIERSPVRLCRKQRQTMLASNDLSSVKAWQIGTKEVAFITSAGGKISDAKASHEMAGAYCRTGITSE